MNTNVSASEKLNGTGHVCEEIYCVQDYIGKIEQLTPEIEEEGCSGWEEDMGMSCRPRISVYFRGHENKNWILQPSVFRGTRRSDNECNIYNNALALSPGDFHADQSAFEKLVRMQHYKVPTRLLDISSNPLIALYFACAELDPANTRTSHLDGEVVMIGVDEDLTKPFSGDTVSCLANLSRLREHERHFLEIDAKVHADKISVSEKIFRERQNKNKFLWSIEIDKERRDAKDKIIRDFNSLTGRLFHFIKEEKAYFEPLINPTDLINIYCVNPKMSNHRLVAQAGAFLLFGMTEELENNNNHNIIIKRIVIKGNATKKHILKQLDSLNINQATVFPQLDSTADWIRKKYD